jgi:DNA-binding transcriptional regulator LsrR (DeoR family)
MNAITRDPALLAKAARLYLLDDRSQDDVAAILGTTRSNVSRMLKQARDLGIVEIRIVDPAGRDQELELALRGRFGLADARVVEAAPETDVLSGVGRLAARWLEETVRDGQVVALSWGHTLQAMVRAVDGLSRRGVEVVQLVGGLSALDSALTGPSPRPLPCPGWGSPGARTRPPTPCAGSSRSWDELAEAAGAGGHADAPAAGGGGRASAIMAV